MRIIAGSLKGRRLQGPEPGDLSIRPTSDRAREALFSILQRWPVGGFLDLFAGTGAVAIEAHSRGYEPVWGVEKTSGALILANGRGTSIQVIRRDVRKIEANAFRELSVIFADPPYEHAGEWWAELAPRLRPWLAPGGVLVWETDRKTELETMNGWELIDSRPYGAARFHFLNHSRG